jgi:perosamine synthetase
MTSLGIHPAPTLAPVHAPIPLCVPELTGNEWTYVKDCLDTGWVSSVGAYVERFERAIADAVGARYAVAMGSGTAALHVALLVAGVEADDEVLVSTLTFIAPANAVRYVGAWPLFVDAEPAHWQMDVDRVAEYLRRDCTWQRGTLRSRRTGRRVRAILPVHVLGHPVDLAPLVALARERGLAVIEDATESLGARYHDRPVGQFGDLACFSFNGNKLLTTGGGGMLVTNDAALAQRARYLSTQAKDDEVEYVHHAVGYNYRLTNVAAALGLAQTERLPAYLARKREIAARYAESLADVPGLTLMREASWASSAWWMYTVLVDPPAFGMDARALLRRLGDARIQTRPLWQPLHRSAAHAGATVLGGATAERLNATALSLPCSVGLTPDAQAVVIDAVRAAAEVA